MPIGSEQNCKNRYLRKFGVISSDAVKAYSVVEMPTVAVKAYSVVEIPTVAVKAYSDVEMPTVAVKLMV